MSKTIAFVEDSFKIEHRGIIVELNHTENGLAKGTKLKSLASDLIWEIDARIFFNHTIQDQQVFENESYEIMSLSFKDLAKREESKKAILHKESVNSYQYLLHPLGHDRKPSKGEELFIVS